MIPYIENTTGVTFFLNNSINRYERSKPNYNVLIEKLERGDEEDYEEFVTSRAAKVSNLLSGYPDFTIELGELYYKNEVQTDYLSRKIVEFYETDRPIEAQINFFLNVIENPSSRAREEAYKFVEFNSLPITRKGTFLAYKRIRANWTDVHSGTISNHIGATPSMPRNFVNDDPSQTCSSGLHVCAFAYLQHFPGERIIVTEQNPRDVVAVPHDYDGTKMRVSQYTVLSEISMDIAENIWANTPYVEIDEDEDENDD
jgi:hypothetical protein